MSKQQVNHVQELARGMNEKMLRAVEEGTYAMGMALGTITANGLIIDGCKDIFQDYMVLDYLTLKDSYWTEKAACSLGTPHKHEFKTPEPIKRLKIGERVLVAQFGADNVVVGRVVSHAKLISG